MSKVFITDYINSPDVEYSILGDSLTMTPKSTVQVILVWHQRINAEYLKQFPNLRGVVRYGVGFDAVDLKLIEEKGLVFCNTPDYGTDEVSDTALAMLLAQSRAIWSYDYDCRCYESGWQENTIRHIRRSSELKVGVIGAGRIGTAFLRKINAIGFQAFFYDPYVNPGYEKAIGVGRFDSLDALLAQSDFISIHTPLTSETFGMIDESFLQKMKKGASIINTARGEIIKDLNVLYDAMTCGHLYSVCLDVLPQEPPIDNKFISAWRKRDPLSRRIIVNPHTSYYSKDSFTEMREKAAINAKRIIDGIPPLNVIAGH